MADQRHARQSGAFGPAVMLHERLDGELDVALLRSCVEQAVTRGFYSEWFPSSAEPAVEVVDLSQRVDPAAARDEWLAEALDRGTWFHAAVLREGPHTVHFVLCARRPNTDEAALHVLADGVLTEYARSDRSLVQPRTDAPVHLDAPPVRSGPHRVSAAAPPALFLRSPGAAGVEQGSFTVPANVVASVRQSGRSLFDFVATALVVYLSRVHNSDDICIGVRFAPREHQGTREAVPLSVTVDQDSSVAVLTDLVRGSASQKAVDRAPGSGRTFDVTLSHVRCSAHPGIPDVRRERTLRGLNDSRDALSVLLREFAGAEEVVLDVSGSTDVFDVDFPVSGVVRQLQALLGAAVHPGATVSGLPLLNETDRAVVLGLGKGAQVGFPRDAALHRLVSQQAERTPNRMAVLGDNALTYAELEREAERIAWGLVARGVRPGDRVAVMVPRGPDLMPTLLGVLMTGAAYVPIDPGYPADRIAYLLEDSAAAVVVTGAGVTETGGSVAAVVASELDARAASVPLPEVSATSLVYVIYTSGSTGRPKGVMIEHRSVVNRLASMQRRYPIGEGDVVLQKTPTSFDVSVSELFWWAVEGASLAMLAPGGERDPWSILDAVAEHGVTVLHFVPSMLGPFLDLIEDDSTLLQEVRSLKYVFSVGEALPPARVNQFSRIFGRGGPALVNLYGPTEATVDVSYHDCPTDRPVTRVPIGRPIDNTALYVVDRHDGLQPVGIPGELLIGGVGVGRGYLGKPDLTAERFGDDPFEPVGRVYRTGDLVRWLENGELEYLGRLDDQVKIRGNRVELGEVRDALARHPGVKDVVVTHRSSETRGADLLAYYVGGAAVTPESLRSIAAKTLPDYMIPALFIPVDRLPLTANGKVNRFALPDP